MYYEYPLIYGQLKISVSWEQNDEPVDVDFSRSSGRHINWWKLSEARQQILSADEALERAKRTWV